MLYSSARLVSLTVFLFLILFLGPSDLREVFHRMGLSGDKDIVALSAGLKLVLLYMDYYGSASRY